LPPQHVGDRREFVEVVLLPGAMLPEHLRALVRIKRTHLLKHVDRIGRRIVIADPRLQPRVAPCLIGNIAIAKLALDARADIDRRTVVDDGAHLIGSHVVPVIDRLAPVEQTLFVKLDDRLLAEAAVEGDP